MLIRLSLVDVLPRAVRRNPKRHVIYGMGLNESLVTWFSGIYPTKLRRPCHSLDRTVACTACERSYQTYDSLKQHFEIAHVGEPLPTK